MLVRTKLIKLGRQWLDEMVGRDRGRFEGVLREAESELMGLGGVE